MARRPSLDTVYLPGGSTHGVCSKDGRPRQRAFYTVPSHASRASLSLQ